MPPTSGPISKFSTSTLKIGEGALPLLGECAGSPSNTLAWAEAYHHAKYQLHPSSRLVTIDMRRKLGRGLCPLFWGARSLSNTKSPVLRPNLRTKWHLDASSRLATIEMGRKLGRGLCPFLGEQERCPHLTKSPRPTSISSAILVHPAIWPQQIWTENWEALSLWGGGAGSPVPT